MTLLAPTSESELKQRACALAGCTLGEIAARWGMPVPNELIYAKGWIGQLIEKALGAQSSNLDQPDFFDLGIELKTIPISIEGKPCESTYICAASIPHYERDWEESRVWRKMAKMLWVPIESHPHKPILSLRIGMAILWSPNQRIAKQLRQDWEELTELIALGDFENLSAHKGVYLQLRPKAQNSKTFIKVANKDGHTISIVPKGFYLRRILTEEIIKESYTL